jgi:hypothetical protein
VSRAGRKAKNRRAADGGAGGPLSIDVRLRPLLTGLFWSLVLVEAGLVALDLLVAHHGTAFPRSLRELFNLTREDSVGTWFASTLTFLVALALWAVFLLVRRAGAPGKSSWSWGAVAAFFTYASLDDGSKFHERVGGVLSRAISGPDLREGIFPYFPSYPWQVIFAPLFAAMGLAILYVVFKELQDRSARNLVLSGLGLLVAAIAVDFVEGVPKYSGFSFADFVRPGTANARHYAKVFEEFLEMLAMNLILVGFLAHLLRRFPHCSVRSDAVPAGK